MAFRNLGSHRLRGLEHVERLYQVVHPDLPDRLPPVASTEDTQPSVAVAQTAVGLVLAVVGVAFAIIPATFWLAWGFGSAPTIVGGIAHAERAEAHRTAGLAPPAWIIGILASPRAGSGFARG